MYFPFRKYMPNPPATSLRIPYTLHRKMNQGNADPGTLGNDFGLFGMVLWGPARAIPRVGSARSPVWLRWHRGLTVAPRQRGPGPYGSAGGTDEFVLRPGSNPGP